MNTNSMRGGNQTKASEKLVMHRVVEPIYCEVVNISGGPTIYSLAICRQYIRGADIFTCNAHQSDKYNIHVVSANTTTCKAKNFNQEKLK